MRKIALIVVLTLVASLLAGCALPMLLFGMTNMYDKIDDNALRAFKSSFL